MSCQKLSRKCLHLVSNQGRGLYSLSRMDVSGLFYPSTAAAEAKYKKTKDTINKLGVVGSIEPLPKPSVHYEPFLSDAHSSIDVFALLGKSNVLYSNKGGYTSIYDTQGHAFIPMPKRNSPKGPGCIATYIKRTAAHASSDFDVSPKVDYNFFARKPIGEHTDSLYIMDMDHDNPCSFEVLACYPQWKWCWQELPPPPFFSDPGYNAPHNVAFAVADGTGICVSSATATYLFDTVEIEWRKIGDWVLPFRAKAEYIPELCMWLGLSACSSYDLCALDLSPAVAGSGDAPLPAVQLFGVDASLPEEWSLRHRTLVNLGSGRLCVASFFHIEDAQEVVVFTGVRVVPRRRGNQQGDRGLRVIRHKSRCLVTDSVKYVL